MLRRFRVGRPDAGGLSAKNMFSSDSAAGVLGSGFTLLSSISAVMDSMRDPKDWLLVLPVMKASTTEVVVLTERLGFAVKRPLRFRA